MARVDLESPVLVTGGTGYIASWIVRQLLEAGHTVHATARNPNKAVRLQELAQGTSGTLKLFQADLLKPGSFDEAMNGCQLVMHTASPFSVRVKDAQNELVRPALEGTRNVLASVNRTESVRRVVLTSSVAAVYGDNADLERARGGVFTEADWNTTSSLKHNPYQYSKTAAEREAWQMSGDQDRWDLVTINPGMVFGPSLTKTTDSGSVEELLRMGRGAYRTGTADLKMGCVDVRDVARAHILAGYSEAASGRHIVVADVMSMVDIGKELRRYFPRYPLPKHAVPKPLVWLMGPLIGGVTRRFVRDNVGLPLRLDNTKSKQSLGLEYRPLGQTLREHFQQLIDDGLVSAR